MERLVIQPVFDSTIPEAAKFLHQRSEDTAVPRHVGVPKRVGEDPVSIERRLRWLLLENPFAISGSSHGFCVRDISGAMRGLVLCFPSRFVQGNRRLMGLASAAFFVEPPARTMGFYLFKRYIKSPGYDFFFSTTCNSNSALLWEKLGGCAVPNTEVEYLLPLRLGSLLPALLAQKTASRVVLKASNLLGRCGDPAMQLFRERPAGIAIEPCRDWEKLANLFHRHRSADFITADRSPELLAWRYGQNADAYPSGIYLFRDKRGNEGWFSLSGAKRGRWGQISGALLADAVWPRERISLSQVLPEIVRLAGGRFDMLSFRQRSGFDYDVRSRWTIRRPLAAPLGFAIDRNGDSRSTATALDLAWADGDSALPVSPTLRSEAPDRRVAFAPPRLSTNGRNSMAMGRQ